VITLGQTFANLRGRPGRTFLTALGTALGIATIVALLAVVGGVRQSAGSLVDLGPSEFGLFQSDAADPTTSILATNLIPQLDRTPGIAAATPLVLLVNDLPKAPGAIVFGANAHGFLTGGLVFNSGRSYRSGGEIVVGDTLAAQLRIALGQHLTIAHRRLLVVGIYHNGIAYQDSGAFVSLGTAQAISGRQGEATTIVVKLDPATKPSTAQRTIARRFPGVEVISDAQQATRAGVSGELISQFGLVIVVLALVIGGIGVANTMLMAVTERRSEFALLSAVGFSGPQIAGRVIEQAGVERAAERFARERLELEPLGGPLHRGLRHSLIHPGAPPSMPGRSIIAPAEAGPPAGSAPARFHRLRCHSGTYPER